MDAITQVEQILTFLGIVLRPFGALAIGVLVGWIARNLLTDSTKAWQLQIAVFLGLVGAMVTMPMFAGAGSVGGFTLGVGLGALISTLMSRRKTAAK